MKNIYKNIVCNEEKKILWITINRPKVLNAMSLSCVNEMIVAIEEANSNQNIRVIIICGSGERAFTSGADIKEIKNYSGTEMEPYNRRWIKLFSIIEKSPKPVIAAVNGFATGGGTEMSLACDFVVASDTAKFGLAEINIGVIPGAGAAVRLTRWVGRLKAKEILMLGRQITGHEAVAMGLANECVTSDQLKERAKEIADELSAKPPLALQAAKSCVNYISESEIDLAIDHELNEFLRLFWTEDQKEGMQAFLQKRKPIFTGR